MSEPADISGMSFEAALAELEQIVGKLESGQAPLEDSIHMYERGAALKAHCETRLEGGFPLAPPLKIEPCPNPPTSPP